MVYIGSYKSKFIEYKNGIKILEVLLKEDDPNISYRKYKNLENDMEVDIDIDFYEFYEKNVNIIKIPNCKTKKGVYKKIKKNI